jgi:proteasome assembly chaperone (PAC2) family protein
MLSQQMQMQHQFLQQQMQMQMAAMEKRAETSEKYLRRIAKTIGKNNKRKRGGDNNDYDSTDDESDE